MVKEGTERKNSYEEDFSLFCPFQHIHHLVERKSMKEATTHIRQPYVVTMSRHRLNVHEMRIMFRIVEALQKDMIYGKQRLAVQETIYGDKIIQLPTKLLLPKGKNYEYVKRALRALRIKSITINGKDESGEYEVNASLITESKYYLNSQVVEIQLSRHLLPSYLALAKNYSQYLLEVAFNSSSTYVMKLYQFFSHWRDKTKKTVMLDTLRDWLYLEAKYEKPKDLRKRVLEPASKELKKRADVWFEIEAPIKTGRSIMGYIFRIYKRKNDPLLESSYAQHIRNVLRELFDLRAYHLNRLKAIISQSTLHDHIYEKIQEIATQVRKGHIQHVKAYVVKALQNEFKDHDETVNEVGSDATLSQEELDAVEYVRSMGQKIF